MQRLDHWRAHNVVYARVHLFQISYFTVYLCGQKLDLLGQVLLLHPLFEVLFSGKRGEEHIDDGL